MATGSLQGNVNSSAWSRWALIRSYSSRSAAVREAFVFEMRFIGSTVILTVLSFIQFPVPGLGEKYWSLSGFPSHAFQSGGGAFLTVIFGQIFAYSAFNDSHFSSPGSVSALIASTGHSGSQTLQSMHSSGWMTSMFSPS